MHNLFLTKQLALDSGVQGEVYIGHKNIHNVCKINGNVITYVYTKSNWEPEVSFEVVLHCEKVDAISSTHYSVASLQRAKDAKKFYESIHLECPVEIIKVQKSKVIL